MSGLYDVCEPEQMHRAPAPKPKKNFGNLQKKTQQQPTQKGIGRLPKQRQYFDSAEYSMSREAQKREEEGKKDDVQKDVK